jgi:hypothetical protein
VQASASCFRDRLASLELPGTVWVGSKPAEPVRRLATGIPPLDALLDGGFPRGHLCEIAGGLSSGRTALACALLASATRNGEVTAVVDLPDALHPETLRLAGADLSRVLWVRPPALQAGLECAELILSSRGFGLLVLDLDGPSDLRLSPKVWVRLTRRARQAGTTLTVLSRSRLAGSFATLSLALTSQRVLWTPPPWRLFEGMAVQAMVARTRFGTAGESLRLRLGHESWVMSHV